MLKSDILDKIKDSQQNNPDYCLRQILTHRLQAGGSLSWRKVCNCLRSPTVSRNDVAEGIEEWRKGTAIALDVHVHFLHTIF